MKVTIGLDDDDAVHDSGEYWLGLSIVASVALMAAVMIVGFA